MVSLKQKKQSGFTIVELLIVIVIIGILAGLVVTQILGATAKARDTERKTDIDQISNQLEAYYAQNGTYPNMASVNSATWRTGNHFSAGDSAKSLADPSNAGSAALSATVPTAVGNSYSYVTTPAICTTGTDDSGGTQASATPCTSYTLTAYLESPAGAYTKSAASQ
jgi:prepilin-type N-terminal cleavage/methylation domain-containing protein